MENRKVTHLLVGENIPKLPASTLNWDPTRLLAPISEPQKKVPPPEPRASAAFHSPNTPAPWSAAFNQQIPRLLAIVSLIRQDLETRSQAVLALNKSRRQDVLEHLERLTESKIPGDPTQALESLLTGARSAQQSIALRTYFEEVAWMTLGQALLLKNWNDRGLLSFAESDLAKLNWALSLNLRPLVPVDRENWQITRQNIYSWYTPPTNIQKEIWLTLESLGKTIEKQAPFATLFRYGRAPTLLNSEWNGYDSRFFNSLRQVISARPRVNGQPPHALSLSLRDGQWLNFTRSLGIEWTGFESNPFLILIAELTQLWEKPTAPALWVQGIGLNSATKEQLLLGLNSAKPSSLRRISEIESFDLSILLEEKPIRLSDRSPIATTAREEIEKIPALKKLRAPQTHLGTLQACVALSKLRPGGQLWWIRDQKLSMTEGSEALRFLLDQGKLICEWDLSQVEHQLPSSSQLFPKFIYLWVKENQLLNRQNHRPQLVRATGNLRSHIEVPQFLEDLLHLRIGQNRNSWQIHGQTSATHQREWSEHWPEAFAHETLKDLDELKNNSHHLATVATVRATPLLPPPAMSWTHRAGQGVGFWIRWEDQKLIIEDLNRPDEQITTHVGSGFLVTLPQKSWGPPLREYLKTTRVRKWLEHHAERKSGKPVLTEALVKYIPIPSILIAALKEDPDSTLTGSAQEAWLSAKSSVRVRSRAFVATSNRVQQIIQSQQKLFDMVKANGQMEWKKILSLLPPAEQCALSIHSQIQLVGQLPPHLPIERIDRIKTPQPAIMLTSNSGFSLQIRCNHPSLLQMLENQLEGIEHPTWSELLLHLKVPRNVENALLTANDVLKTHGQVLTQLNSLREFLDGCSWIDHSRN